jgi:phage repressor protein C with HTH and peptisase S24 domain
MTMEPGELIRKRREELGLSQAQLAKQSGGISQATVEKIEKGETLRSKFLPLIAKRLGLPLESLDPSLAGLPEAAERPPAPPPILVSRDRDFPIYASVEGGPGEILRSTDPIDFIPRPAPVAHVKEAYGLVVTGESMAPEFKPGETALVNPKLPLIADEVYVFYSEMHGEARATIKHLRRATPTAWLVSQHNPPRGKSKEFELPREEWRWAHRVFGKHSRQ